MIQVLASPAALAHALRYMFRSAAPQTPASFPMKPCSAYGHRCLTSSLPCFCSARPRCQLPGLRSGARLTAFYEPSDGRSFDQVLQC